MPSVTSCLAISRRRNGRRPPIELISVGRHRARGAAQAHSHTHKRARAHSAATRLKQFASIISAQCARRRLWYGSSRRTSDTSSCKGRALTGSVRGRQLSAGSEQGARGPACGGDHGKKAHDNHARFHATPKLKPRRQRGKMQTPIGSPYYCCFIALVQH